MEAIISGTKNIVEPDGAPHVNQPPWRKEKPKSNTDDEQAGGDPKGQVQRIVTGIEQTQRARLSPVSSSATLDPNSPSKCIMEELDPDKEQSKSKAHQLLAHGDPRRPEPSRGPDDCKADSNKKKKNKKDKKEKKEKESHIIAGELTAPGGDAKTAATSTSHGGAFNRIRGLLLAKQAASSSSNGATQGQEEQGATVEVPLAARQNFEKYLRSELDQREIDKWVQEYGAQSPAKQMQGLVKAIQDKQELTGNGRAL